MRLIEDLKEVAEHARLNSHHTAITIDKARAVFGVEADPDSYGVDLANVFAKIAGRIGKEYVPVPLGKEGKPLEVGRRYFGKDGRSWMVLGFKPCSYDVVGMSNEGSLNTHLKGRWLSFKQPDTQERIDEDKAKQTFAYWGCVGFRCNECPARVDGKKPYERYGLERAKEPCCIAMGYDLALRQARLDGRA